VLALGLLWSAGAFGQAYPAKALRLVNGFPAGGGSDIVARLIASKLAETLAQPVVVEPRVGAGGLLALEHVAKSPPDGYTLMLITGAFPAQAAILKKLPFDPITDYAYISTLTFYPFTVNVNAGSAHKTLDELISHVRANPGKLNCASSGIGTIHHLSCELFGVMAGAELVHVPFKGGAAPMTELMAGRIDVLFETMTLSLPQIQSGKIRALGVTSIAPSFALPAVPTVARSLPGYEVNSFIGLAAPAGTPVPVIERLNKDVRTILAQPESRPRFIELGGEPKGSSPDEMRDFVANEIEKWKKVIVARKIEQQ
jgi:tripartite-type tricarboxylate transporter receptor subunit TctC